MSCVLCQSDEFTELFRGSDRLYRTTDEMFPVVRCGNCGMVRMEPVPSELSRYYPHNYWFKPQSSLAGRMEELYRRILIRDHVRFVARAWRDSGEAGPVLDVGCGGGLFLRMLGAHGMPVIGLDASIEAAHLAWSYNGVPVFCGDLARAPLSKVSCSVVTMFHVVEHLPDPPAYLHAARALLQPNGRLVVQVPNIDCWQFKILGQSWSGVDLPRHLNDFRARDIVKLVQSCGFDVVRTKQFSWRDNPAGLATSVAPSLEPVARRVRGLDASAFSSLAKDAAYLALVVAAVPFAALEAAFGAGSTIMLEAKKRP